MRVSRFLKFAQFVVVFIIIFAWIFSGWPQIWQNPPIPPKIQEAQAAVSHDATSESHTGITGSTNQVSFSWSHAGAASGVKGVIVFVFQANNTGDDATSVTYGGSSLDKVSGGSAVDTAGEPGRVTAWFLGSSVLQGTQDVVVNRNNNANIMYATVATVTGNGNTEVYTSGIVLLEENGAFAEQSVDDGSPGTNSLRYAAGYNGGNNPGAAGANSNLLQQIDFGSYGAAFVCETTAGQGSRLVGLTSSADDRAGVHLAVREVVYSVTVEPTSVGYGGMILGDTKASVTITATVGNAPTKLLINGSNATYSTYTWTLSPSIGTIDQYLHAYTTDLAEASGTAITEDYTTGWEDLLTGTSTLATSVGAGLTQTFKLDMRTPASISGGQGNQFQTTVTVTATAP